MCYEQENVTRGNIEALSAHRRARLFSFLRNLIVAFLTLHVSAVIGAAQQTDQGSLKDLNQDVLKIPVEEVRIPVFASDGQGRSDMQLSASDVFIREDGVAQSIRGVYRVPAHVLLLLDTGGELNLLKTVRLTTDVAIEFTSKLRPEDSVAVMQVNGKVELISDWSTNHSDTIHSIRTKLLPGKLTLLTEGLMQAVENLQKTPVGNRHLVIISDGLDSSNRRSKLERHDNNRHNSTRHQLHLAHR